MSQVAAGADRLPTAIERLTGGLLVAAATLLVAVEECFLVGLRAGHLRLPASIALAVLLHPILTLLMGGLTRSKAAMFVPFAIWAVVVLQFGARRAEGDLVLTAGNWVVDGLLALGALAFAITLGLRLPAGMGPRGSLGSNGSR